MKSLEIFSGVGGLAKGLELSGFEHSSFVELNKDACKSLRLNFDPKLVYEGDIAKFDFGALSDIDIVAGGPPCQPFSLGGKHKAHQDKRDMFPYAIKAIETLRPKAFIFENVKGLLRQAFSEYFTYILLRLTYPDCEILDDEDWRQHLGRLQKLKRINSACNCYNVQYKLLNAADYGVPQIRERVVIVGIRADLGKEFTYPKSTHTKDRLLWDKHVTGEYWSRHNLPDQRNESIGAKLTNMYGLFPPEGEAWLTVRDCLKDVPQPEQTNNIKDHIFRDCARAYIGHSGSDIDEPSKTIKAGGHGVPGGENMIRYEDGSVRYFTVYEGKLIQTFPKDYQIAGSWGEAMRQIGNAVPVRLANAIGRSMMQVLAL